MNQTQLLAIDTILPTILGIGGLIFVAAALWPIGREFAKRDRLSASLIGVIGAGCLGASVWLWLLLYGSEGHVLDVQPGTSVTTVVSVPPNAQASRAASPSTTGGATPSSSAPGSGSSSPAAGASAFGSAASTGASSPSGASSATSSQAPASSAPPAAPTLAPTPTIALTPVPAASFQPDNGAHGVVLAVEPFERGFMLYRDNLKLIYVLAQDKTFKTYPDSWVEGTNPDLGGLSNQPNKLVPGRGFGWLWASDKDVQSTLGLAIGKEMGFSGQVSGDGSTVTLRADSTYVLSKDGTWTLR